MPLPPIVVELFPALAGFAIAGGGWLLARYIHAGRRP